MAVANLYIVYALNSAMCTAVCAGVACGDTSYITRLSGGLGSLTSWDYKQNEPGYNIEYDLAIAPMVMHYNTNNVLDDRVIAWLWLCVWLCI